MVCTPPLAATSSDGCYGNYLPDDVGLDSEGFIEFGNALQQAVNDGYIATTIDYATADALFEMVVCPSSSMARGRSILIASPASTTRLIRCRKAPVVRDGRSWVRKGL